MPGFRREAARQYVAHAGDTSTVTLTLLRVEVGTTVGRGSVADRFVEKQPGKLKGESMKTTNRRTIAASLAVVSLTMAACGSSKSGGASDTTVAGGAATTAGATTTTAGGATTTAGSTATTAAAAEPTTEAEWEALWAEPA